MNGRRVLVACAVVAFLVAAPGVTFSQNNHPGLDAPGFQQNRDYFSQMPFEHIDTLSGSLVLTFTDLVLPGNAGRELKFQRTYNSKNGVWSFGIVGYALRIAEAPYPTAETPEFQEATPALHMADGSVRKMAWQEVPNINQQSTFDKVISSDFWKLHRPSKILSIPNGDTCEYEVEATYTLRVKSCKDAFNNETAFTWQTSPPRLTITQHVGEDSLTILVNFAVAGGTYPTSLEYDGKIWTYSPTTVTPPSGEGPGWAFTYTGLDLTSLTTPHGGVIEYEYDNINYEGPNSPQTTYWTRVVKTRTMIARGGGDIGEWSYDYAIGANGISGTTTVYTPTGRVLYAHGWTESPLAVFDAEGGVLPLTQRKVQTHDGSDWVTLEQEDRTYTLVTVLGWWNFGTLELNTRTITRFSPGASQTFVTDNEYDALNFGDYHRPYRITETGTAGTRVTNITYKHPQFVSDPYVVALPIAESVEVGAETVTKERTYTTKGFKTSETADGITTLFGQTSSGNVSWIKKANDKTTSFLNYQYGQPGTIRLPEYDITRSINPDGTIATETRAGRSTAFTYDGLGRLRVTQPPGEMNPTAIDYDTAAGEWVRTQRGTSVVTALLDGFGRRIEQINSLDVHTKTGYDAEGRVTRESYPHDPGALSGGQDIGTDIEYDALGRVTKRTNPGGAYSTRSYEANGTVTVVDEEGRITTLYWGAFGNPDEARLGAVNDALGQTWLYTYTALGRLTLVEGGGITRAWLFNEHNLLEDEIHPESGTTHYEYDAAGVLISKTDANQITTTFTHDGNDRVNTVTANSQQTVHTYEVGSDNRVSATNPSAGITWQYDAYTGRLLYRQDTIDAKIYTTWFEYDHSDNLTAIIYPSGRRVQYDLNTEGQPTRVYEPALNRNHANTITYHASGGLQSYVADNGITTSISYHGDRYWIVGIDSGDLQIAYGDYDAVGNPRWIVDSRTGYSQTLGYDALDRLTRASGIYGEPTYSYDAHGNRNDAGYQYHQTTWRLMSDPAISYQYDNNGNTLTAGSATFTYTPQNQVAMATNLGATVNYAYNADEQRVKVASAGTSTYYIRGINGELLTEWKNPGTATGRVRDYIYLGSRLLSAVAKDTTEDPAGYMPPVSTSTHVYATSWQVPTSTGDEALANTGITAAARKSTHPDMPRTGIRLGISNGAGTVAQFRNGPLMLGNNSGSPKQGGVFLEFQIERNPILGDAEILGTSGSYSTDDLRLYVTTGGQLVLKHHGARTTPLTLWTSPAIALHNPHTLELRFEYNSEDGPYVAPNPAWEHLTSRAQVFFDGALVATYGASAGGTWDNQEAYPLGLDYRFGTAFLIITKLKSPDRTNGLLMDVFRAGVTSAQTHGDTLDHYGNTWRTTLLQPAGAGTYSQWTGGQPDWRARSIISDPVMWQNMVTTNVPAQKISYLMESMSSKGISGNIGVVLVGVRTNNIPAGTKAFIRRNGVETILDDFTLGSQDTRWYRVANSGWSPNDVIEVGVLSGASTSTTHLHSVALLVEHNTPEPAPLTDTSARVVTVNYTGNGGAQTIDFPGINAWPTVMFVIPATGLTSTEPMWWWDSRQGAASFSDSGVSFNHVWPQKGKFHVTHTTANSYNANGVGYVAVALFDPSGRFVMPFAVSKPSTDDNYVHQLRYPQTGELAETFTPDFVFGGSAFGGTTTTASYYRGPGHTGDSTAKLGVAQASDADRIQAIGPGAVTFGTLVNSASGDNAFWAGRVNDGVSSTRLMAVTSYVGDGATSRNIPLALTGSTPVFALVVPTTATAKVYRVTGDTTGRRTDVASAVANSITAMGANQITVGTAMNAVGVTYDVWAITTGVVNPQ